ncbi:MAG: aldehyde ferredoxin oxidoreductase family protein [Desulfobacteraceae bacterium]|nr:aldehyde ferredoxin oxidoreductase family protein [Desulfobacteraceae bacterium]
MTLLGDIVEVDLSTGKWQRQPYPEALAERMLWGRGFNAEYLCRHIPPGTDPCGPENVLLFSCGLLTGTAAPTSARLHVSALSPLTGLLGSSNVGGGFGARLRSCGIQTLVLRGRSPHPVYLHIHGRGLVLADAEAFWGLDTWNTQERIRSRIGDPRARMMAIGPAGEKGVRFACIVTDADHAAGRTGMGAVMGAKRLKAVVVSRGAMRASDGMSASAASAFRRYVRRIQQSKEYPKLATHGGAGYVKWADEMGIVATRNFRQHRFESIDRIDGRKLSRHVTRTSGCFRCPVRCKAELRMHGRTLQRPEFESMLNLGAKCGLADLESLVFLDNLCTRLGLDSISTGSVIAFAMDLYERGILTVADTEGLDLTWGNAPAMKALVLRIAARRGFGRVLSDGIQAAAERIGRSADAFAPHVKGLELAAYHPGRMAGTALGYAVSSRGGDFNSVYASLEYTWSREKARRVFGTEAAVEPSATEAKGAMIGRAVVVNTVLDCLGLCKIPVLSLLGAFDLKNESELVSAATGRSVRPAQLSAMGERVVATERVFNLRMRPQAPEDRLPAMFTDGAGTYVDRAKLSSMVQDYYRAMGWDEEGVPPETAPAAADAAFFSTDHDSSAPEDPAAQETDAEPKTRARPSLQAPSSRKHTPGKRPSARVRRKGASEPLP